MKHYFIVINEKKEGPYTLEQLKNIKLSEKTLVWRSDFNDWKSISEVEELKEQIIIEPPKTKMEQIDERINKDNELIKKIVIKRTLIYYLVISLIITLISVNNTNNFMTHSLMDNRGQKWYYFSDSIITRSIQSTFGDISIEGGEYESDVLLFFNLFSSSLIFFSLIFIPFGIIYYKMSESKREHYI